MRAAYAAHGVAGFYAEHGKDYRNAHFERLTTAAHAALDAVFAAPADIAGSGGEEDAEAAAAARLECNVLRLGGGGDSRVGGSKAGGDWSGGRRAPQQLLQQPPQPPQLLQQHPQQHPQQQQQKQPDSPAVSGERPQSSSGGGGGEGSSGLGSSGGAAPSSGPQPNANDGCAHTPDAAALRVLDLACGSGEGSLAVWSWLARRAAPGGPSELHLTAADPFTAAAFTQRTGLPRVRAWSFEDVQEGALEGRRYDLAVVSFALHLLETTRLHAFLHALARSCRWLLILSPHKRPHVAESAWRLAADRTEERVHARLYESFLLA
ncbi:hypothetical protein Rsub_05735 [Raphidocelis subcapitata]|uniref:Methyltransferase domain-containing protein n=1 Tax=Raphidocelis subcapitata TaxID=307507 RepID=A0A2V0NZZ4_9CHLO|nr:hypothetical protein Rsub_05735 [Raphidocelis subcapitata]|eukprot:GBF92899.1 hypothetical protein Rsub_05735 [Raphidocelis subcapitata]